MKAKLREQCPLCLWSVDSLIDGVCRDCTKERREAEEAGALQAKKEQGRMSARIDEGDNCPEGCGGTMQPRDVENCSCHISPPCHACVSAGIECDTCGWELTEDNG